MSHRPRNLHGSAPDKSPVALLLIDVINDLDFPEAPRLVEFALPMARQIRELNQQARRHDVPIVYVNDNFGRWRSDFSAQVRHCLEDDVLGKPIAELLAPGEDDYFVLKPKHSGFYSTSLDLLLQSLGVHTVVVTGMATNICVLFTANDAYMRDLRVIVPSDCCAANTREVHDYAIEQMRLVLKADVRPSTELQFAELLRDREG
jgi:nicotinamidase-related amidase